MPSLPHSASPESTRSFRLPPLSPHKNSLFSFRQWRPPHTQSPPLPNSQVLQRNKLYHKLKYDLRALRRIRNGQEYNYYSIDRSHPKPAYDSPAKSTRTEPTQHKNSSADGSARSLKISRSHVSARAMPGKKGKAGVGCVGLVGLGLGRVVTEPVDVMVAQRQSRVVDSQTLQVNGKEEDRPPVSLLRKISYNNLDSTIGLALKYKKTKPGRQQHPMKHKLKGKLPQLGLTSLRGWTRYEKPLGAEPDDYLTHE